MSITTKRTIYGNQLQTAQFSGSKHVVMENSTLNEKFSILAGEQPDSQPDNGYYVIGIGGHMNYTGSDGMALTKPRHHRARDAALFKHLPFVMREVTDDLDANLRNKYCLRVIENWGGIDYYCYYGKRVNVSAAPIISEHTIIKDGQPDIIPFIAAPEDLNPVPVDIAVEGVTPGSGETLSATQQVTINFDGNDVKELKQVCRIRFNDEAYAVVSEVGLCSGVDKQVPHQPAGGGQAYNFLEVQACQVSLFVSCLYPLAFSNDGFALKIDMGASEPLAVEVGGVGAPMTASYAVA